MVDTGLESDEVERKGEKEIDGRVVGEEKNKYVLDIDPVPPGCGNYHARTHVPGCECGCDIGFDQKQSIMHHSPVNNKHYIKIDNINHKYMEMDTFYHLISGGELLIPPSSSPPPRFGPAPRNKRSKNKKRKRMWGSLNRRQEKKNEAKTQS